MARLKGGSAGERSREFGHPFFREGIKVIEFRAKNVYQVRLLPAFSDEVDEADPSFLTSFKPYRDKDTQDENGHGVFTDWFFPLQGHRWVGRGNKGFLSPLNLPEGKDPLLECYKVAKRKESKWYALTQQSTGKKAADLSRPRDYAAYNIVAFDEHNQPYNSIGITTGAALLDLKEQLNTLRPAKQIEAPDPEWPDYLFGDVTSPYYGLLATVRETPINEENKAGMTTSCFHFSTSRELLLNHQYYSVDPREDYAVTLLQGRVLIGDTDNILQVSSEDEILDYIVNDGFLPYDLIQEACANLWNVPTPRVVRSYSPPPALPAPSQALSHAHLPPPGYQQPQLPPPRPPGPSALPPGHAAAGVTHPQTPRPPVPHPASNPGANRLPALPIAHRPSGPGLPPIPQASSHAHLPPPTGQVTPPVSRPLPPRPPTGGASPGGGRPAGPALPPRPPTPMPPRPPALPPRPPTPAPPPPRPPVQPAQTLPPVQQAQEAHQAQPPLSPEEQAGYADSSGAPAEAADPAGLTPEESNEYMTLTARFSADMNSLSAAEADRMTELGNRGGASSG